MCCAVKYVDGVCVMRTEQCVFVGVNLCGVVSLDRTVV